MNGNYARYSYKTRKISIGKLMAIRLGVKTKFKNFCINLLAVLLVLVLFAVTEPAKRKKFF
jgi:hypothetical protein